jgi:hypothetical protein
MQECTHCNASDKEFAHCGACLTPYCDSDCQQEDWAIHSRYCTGRLLFRRNETTKGYELIGPPKRIDPFSDTSESKKAKQHPGFPQFLDYEPRLEDEEERKLVAQINGQIALLIEHCSNLHDADIPNFVQLESVRSKRQFSFQFSKTTLVCYFEFFSEDRVAPIHFAPDPENPQHVLHVRRWSELPVQLTQAFKYEARLVILQKIKIWVDDLTITAGKLYSDVGEVVRFMEDTFGEWTTNAQPSIWLGTVLPRQHTDFVLSARLGHIDMKRASLGFDYSYFSLVVLPALKIFFSANTAEDSGKWIYNKATTPLIPIPTAAPPPAQTAGFNASQFTTVLGLLRNLSDQQRIDTLALANKASTPPGMSNPAFWAGVERILGDAKFAEFKNLLRQYFPTSKPIASNDQSARFLFEAISRTRNILPADKANIQRVYGKWMHSQPATFNANFAVLMQRLFGQFYPLLQTRATEFSKDPTIHHFGSYTPKWELTDETRAILVRYATT